MSLVSRLLSKHWTDAQIDMLLGDRDSTALICASDPSVRDEAASGGAVTALLLSALESGTVDGVLVCSTVITDGLVRPRFSIAQTRNELLESRGSVYLATRFARDALPVIHAHPGRIAVVGLPCDLAVLREATDADPSLSDRTVLTVGLVCGHSSTHELTDMVVERLKRQTDSPLSWFRHRVGHWRGSTVARFEDGSVIEQPFKRFSVYQNLYYFADTKCMYCGDHFARNADISAGDVWAMELKSNEIKHTGVIVRSERGRDAISAAVDSGALQVTTCPPSLILDGQARTAPFHHNVSARAKAGRLFGMNIPDRNPMPVRPHEYLAALIALANYRATRTPGGRRFVRCIPRPILTVYLYVLKGLESIR